MYFLRPWAMSALAALGAIVVVLSAWLLIHLGFDVQETMRRMLGYISNARLVVLAVVVSALIGLIEVAVMKFWRRTSKRT
jgi:uncharacterized membrane protein